ncbi:ATP-dependent DNA helicase OS=Stutzerimonas stutzeri OX=316 GN=CXK95_16760 PE=4 SV=1 [Stutzerimonas stutzeri]
MCWPSRSSPKWPVANGREAALLALIRRAMPYAALDETSYQALLTMLAEGYTTRHGARGAYLHRDLATHSLRARRGGRGRPR